MKKPTTAEEFDQFMLDIDRILKSNNVSMPLRPIYAFSEIAKKFKIELKITGTGSPIENNYEGDSLSAHIIKWFNERYGDQLKLDFATCYLVILIKGDPYRLTIPRIYGRGRFIFDETFKKRKTLSIGKGGSVPEPLEINVYELIDGLTRTIVRSITVNEEKEIMDFISDSFNAVYRLDEVINLPYKLEAKSDLRTAVEIILNEQANYGLSKWSTLQFVEKILKGLLEQNKISFPKTHNIKKLNTLLKNNDLPNIPEDILADIECSADVRYDKKLVSRREAINAHHASLESLKYLFAKSYNHINKNY